MAKQKKSRRKIAPAGRAKKTARNQRKFPFGKLLLALVVALTGLLMYLPSQHYDFVYDDDAVIKENRYVKSGSDGLGKIWSTSYFKGYDEGINARAFRPIPLTTFAYEVEWFGLNPTVHHRGNIFYYFLTGMMLTIFLLRLFKNSHFLLPFAIALLFMLHPVHIEVVANIKSRDALLGFLGIITTGWFYLKYWDTKSASRYAWLGGAVVAYFFALFSKEETITFLAPLAVLPYFFRRAPLRESLLALIPFVVLAGIFVVYRSGVIGGLNAGVEIKPLDNSLLAAEGIGERIASTIYVLGYYLYKNIIPHPLLSDYSLQTLPLVGWGDYRVYLSLLAYGGLLFLMIKGWKNRRSWAFGIFWYFAALSIFSSVLFPNVNAYADRFNYTPSLGIIILVLTALWQIGKPLSKATISTSGLLAFPYGQAAKAKPVFLITFLILAGLSIFKISTHLPVWENRFTLFEHDVVAAPNNARMLKNYGGSLVMKAMEVQTTDKPLCEQYSQQAVNVLERQQSIFPRIPTGYIHKGIALTFLGRLDEAVASYKKALGMDPDNYHALVNISNTLYRQGRYQEAAEHMQGIAPERLQPNDFYLLSLIYTKLGNSEAAAEFRKRSGR